MDNKKISAIEKIFFYRNQVFLYYLERRHWSYLQLHLALQHSLNLTESKKNNKNKNINSRIRFGIDEILELRKNLISL